MNTFGEWILNRRKEARLTQEELAKKAGISPSYVSAIERNQRHSITGAELMPDVEKVEALARALNADVDEARSTAGYARLHTSSESYEVCDDVTIIISDRVSQEVRERIVEGTRLVTFGAKASSSNNYENQTISILDSSGNAKE